MYKIDMKKGSIRKKKAPVGNTGGGGFSFENLAAARFLLDLLGLTHTLGVENFGKVIRLDWQARDSGWLADDLVVTSQLGSNRRSAAVSAKSGQSVTILGFPTDFVQTAWAQWFQDGTSRIFRNTDDVIVLVTGNGTHAAEGPWSKLLQESLATTPDRMLARLIDDKEAGQQTSKEQRAIFRGFACPKGFATKHSGNEETVELVRQIRWVNFDFQKPESRHYGLAVSDCKTVLVARETHRGAELWERLIGISDEKRRLGGMLDLPGLLKELKGRFNFKENPDFAADWAELDKRSAAEMAEIKTEIAGLPRLPRNGDLEAIQTELDARSACFLVGDSGCGKSALAKEFAAANRKRAVWFANDALEYASLPDFEKGIGLLHGITEIIDGTVESTILVFDAVEGYSKKAKKVASQIIRAIRASASSGRTPIILTAQAEGAPSLIGDLLSLGVPNDVLETTVVNRPAEPDVRTIVVGFPKVGWVALSLEMKTLLTNLKMLDWFVQFSQSGGTIDTSNVGLTNLIDSLWSHWVETGNDKYAKSALLMKVASIEADNHVSSVPCSLLEPAERETLGKVANGELLRVQNNRIRFSHDLLSDWARLQALIDGEWLAAPQSRERFTSPRWFRAIRLYGQRLLEQSADGCKSWRKSLEAVDDDTPTGKLIRDLFLEALFLAPNSATLLEQAWPVLVANSGKLLNVLIERFLYVATLPDPRLKLMLDEGQDISKYEHLMRLPFWPYWGPLIRILHAHREDVVRSVPKSASKVSALWLRTMNFGDRRVIWRQEAAELALAIAREVQFYDEQRAYFAGGADEIVFEALLYAATELPNEVGQLCLELSKRRDLDPRVAKRVGEAIAKRREERKKQQGSAPKRNPLPAPISLLGQLTRPWPDGPRSRVDHDFQSACLDGTAFGFFAKANPDAALEVLLAVCIEEPQHEEYGQSHLEELGLDYWQAGEPPMWFRGPFQSFLNATPEKGLTFIIKLTNFVTQRYSRGQGITFKIGGKHKHWLGDSNAFVWHYDGHTMHGTILHCALMALEKWLYDQLEAKADIAPVLSRIMNESESLAFAGLLLTVGKMEPNLLVGAIEPLLESWLLWSWDFQLTEQREHGLRGGLAGYWGSQPQAAVKLAQAWINLPHRLKSVRNILVVKFLPLKEHEKLFKKLIKAWENQLDKDRMPVELRQLVEVIRKENYKFSTVDGVLAPIKFNLPEADQVEFDTKAQKAAEHLQVLQLPMRCREILDAGTRFKPEQLEQFYGFIKSISGKVAERDEDGDEPVHAVEDGVFGGIAVLMTLHYEWLSSDASRLTWCRTQLEASLTTPPPRSRYFSEASIGNNTWNAFAAECGVSMLATNPSDALARALVFRGIVSFFHSTTQLIVNKAAPLRAELKDDFKRMVGAVLHWSAIRPALRILQPNFTTEISRWEKHKAELEKSFNDGSLSPTLPDIKSLNTATRKALDKIHAMQYPEHAAFLKAKASRKGPRDSREELHPEHLGLDTHIVTAGLSWITLRSAAAPAERAEMISWLVKLLDMVLATIPVIEDRNTQELEGLPSDFDSWVFGLLADAIPLLDPTEKPEQLWQPILDLGPHPHDWVERFYWDWFTRGTRAKPDLNDFFRQWRAMIEFALNSPKWDRKANWHYQLDSMIFELLGFDGRWSVWKSIEGVATHIDAMADLYERAAVKWFDMPKVLGGFVSFAASLPASSLALKSIPWVAAAIKDYDSYKWRHGPEEAAIDFLDTCWQRNAAKITGDVALRTAFFSALAALAARGSHAAIALRDRVADDTQS
jgi:hypothetical protein